MTIFRTALLPVAFAALAAISVQSTSNALSPLRTNPQYSVTTAALPKGTILTKQNIKAVTVQSYSQMPRDAVSGWDILLGCKTYAATAKGEAITSAVISAAKNGIDLPLPLWCKYTSAANQYVDAKRFDEGRRYAWAALAELEKLAKTNAKLQDYTTTCNLTDLGAVFGNILSIQHRDNIEYEKGTQGAMKKLAEERAELLFYQRLQAALTKLLPPGQMHLVSVADNIEMSQKSIESTQSLIDVYKERDALRK